MNAILKPFNVLHEVKQIPYWEVDSVWKEAGPLILKGIETQDELTIDSIYRTLKDPLYQPAMQLWYIPNLFAAVTQVNQYPSGIRKCTIVVGGGGGLTNIQQELHKLEEWAKNYQRCHKVIIYGRQGWTVLPGYKRIASIMEKDLWAWQE